VGAHYYRSEANGSKVRNEMLHRMIVDRGYTCRSSPLMVDLVDVLVEFWMMKQPVNKIIIITYHN